MLTGEPASSTGDAHPVPDGWRRPDILARLARYPVMVFGSVPVARAARRPSTTSRRVLTDSGADQKCLAGSVNTRPLTRTAPETVGRAPATVVPVVPGSRPSRLNGVDSRYVPPVDVTVTGRLAARVRSRARVRVRAGRLAAPGAASCPSGDATIVDPVAARATVATPATGTKTPTIVSHCRTRSAFPSAIDTHRGLVTASPDDKGRSNGRPSPTVSRHGPP